MKKAYPIVMILAATMLCLLYAVSAGLAEDTVVLPSATKVIEDEAFFGDTSIERAIVPEGVTTISARAFAGSSLKAIELPDTLTSISEDAFENCGHVTAVGKKDGVMEAWSHTHGMPVRLKDGAYPESPHPYLPDSDWVWEYVYPGEAVALKVTFSEDTKTEFARDYITVDRIPYSGDALKGESIVIPGGSFQIKLHSGSSGELYGFRIADIHPMTQQEWDDYRGIQFIVDDQGVLTGFLGKMVGDIVIPAEVNGRKVTAIGHNAFADCADMTGVDIPYGVTRIEGSAFGYCSGLQYVHLPETLKEIGDFAFAQCGSLISIEIPNGVAVVDYGAFGWCHGLKTVRIPASLTTINGLGADDFDDPFFCCTSLMSIQVDEDNPVYCDVDGVLMTKDRSRICLYPEGKASTGEFRIPANMTDIGFLFNNNHLTNIWVDDANPEFCDVDGVLFTKDEKTLCLYPGARVGAYEIPKSVTSIEYAQRVSEYTYKIYDAFSGCSGLTSIRIPAGLTQIGDFEGCSSLTSIKVDPQNPVYCDVDGVLFTKDMKTLCLYPGARAGAYYSIPETVTDISYWAFTDCVHLTSIRIPKEMTNLITEYGEPSFDGSCLTHIEVDLNNSAYCDVDGVLFTKDKKTLCWYPRARAGAYEIPDTVTVIGAWTFDGCVNLTDVSIPAGVSSIGYHSFSDCENLLSVNIPADSKLTVIGGDAFSGCGRLANIDIPASVTDIGSYAFYYCSSLKNVSLPAGLNSIGRRAFRGCSSLRSITIPSGVTRIDWQTFSGCSNLESIVIPPSVTYIDDYETFQACGRLTIYCEKGSAAEDYAKTHHIPCAYGPVPDE